MYEYNCTIIPVRDGLTYTELEDIVRQEFGIREWEVCGLHFLLIAHVHS